MRTGNFYNCESIRRKAKLYQEKIKHTSHKKNMTQVKLLSGARGKNLPNHTKFDLD